MKEQVLKILPHVVPVVNGQPVNGGNGGNSGANGANGTNGTGGSNALRAELKEVHENAQIIGSGDGGVGGSGVDSSGAIAGAGAKKEEVGRNDLCPCGSGKKFKKCHGKND
jgi:preprotein translocase subunit SecA